VPGAEALPPGSQVYIDGYGVFRSAETNATSTAQCGTVNLCSFQVLIDAVLVFTSAR
jgi:hypothetical protein